jgi:hypothetical protein
MAEKSELTNILLIGGVGFLAYEWLTGGLSSFFSSFTTPVTNTTTNTNSTQVMSSGGSTAQVDPIGTVESTAAGIAAQANANLAYIIPSPSIGNLIALTPSGYVSFQTSDTGLVYLRDDVATAVQTSISNTLTRATAAYASQGLSVPVQDIQALATIPLGQIQNIIGSAGLSGVFPITGGYGVGGFGKIAHYNPYSTPTNYQAQVTGWELVSKDSN